MVLVAACLGPVLSPAFSLAQYNQSEPIPGTPPAKPGAKGAPTAPASGTPPGAVVVPTPSGDVTVVADRLEEVGPDKLLVATGNVELTHGAARLMADRVEMNRDTGDAVAQGRVVFYDGENQLTGRRIDYNLKTGTGVVYTAEARTAPYYRIGGERMNRMGESLYEIYKGSFTTCEDDSPTWSFRFGSATADLNDFVYGTNASFWVKDIPLIPFMPVFAAAIRRERQTGFLFPKFGSSSQKGFFTEIPFFWAIDDSSDATIAPIVYAKRGVGASGEYRYVMSEQQRGTVAGYLIQEVFRNDTTKGDFSVRHDWAIAPGLTFKVDGNIVTADDVLKEYGDRLQQRSAQRVESNVFLTKSWESWDFVGNMFAYQDLTTRRPVELNRVPDLSLQGVRQPIPGLPGFLYEADASFVNFMREVGSNGLRADLLTRVSRPIPVAGGLFTMTPFVGGRLTGYDKTVVGFHQSPGITTPLEVTSDDPQLRRLFETGMDVQTILAKPYQVGGFWNVDAILHTIEPAVQYRFITGKGETRLPQWTDIDRIGDTNLIAYGVTNRIRARTIGNAITEEPVRWEAVRFSLLHSYDVLKGQSGDLLSTIILQPSERIRLRSDLAYSTRGDGLQQANNDLTVRVEPVGVTVGSRYSDPGNINFLVTGLSLDVTRYVSIQNTNNYDIRSGTFVESRVATEIKFDCWALTFEYVHRNGRDDEMRFALNLLGLGGPIRTSLGLGTLEGTSR
jgi:LPS-assembly protein